MRWVGVNLRANKLGREKKETKNYLIYIALTIEFGQQYFLNVTYSGLDM